MPLVLSVADLTAGRVTNTTAVLELLARAGVRLAVTSPRLLDLLTQQAGALGMSDYEGEYLARGAQPQVRTKPKGAAILNFSLFRMTLTISLRPWRAPTWAELRVCPRSRAPCFTPRCSARPPSSPAPPSPPAVTTASGPSTSTRGRSGARGRDWRSRARSAAYRWTLSQGQPIQHSQLCLQVELTCLYPPAAPPTCAGAVAALRAELLAESLRRGGVDSQYVNTPSCQVRVRWSFFA